MIVAATASVTVCGGTSVGAPSVARAAAPSASLRLVSSVGSDGLVSLPGWTSVRTVVPSGDGSMLVHLDQSASNGMLLASGVVKVRSDGSLDPAFASTSARPGVVEAGSADARVLVMSDGSFLLGRRHHRSDGTVDTGWGSDGFVTFNGVRVAFGGIAQFEASGNRIVSIRDMRDFGGCYSEIVGPDGELEPFTVRDIRCTEAVPVRMPDGRWYVVTHDVRTGYRIIGYTPDGQIDPTYGNDGVVVIDPAIGPSPRLEDVAATLDGQLLLVSAPVFPQASSVVRVRLDGSLDTAFGDRGRASFAGSASSLLVEDDGSIFVGVTYTFELHENSPEHPTLLRLTPSGTIDSGFNRGGIRAGWFDLTEVGVANPASAGPFERSGTDRVVVGFERRPADRSRGTATLAILEPGLSPLRVRPNGAAADAPAVRLGVVVDS